MMRHIFLLFCTSNNCMWMPDIMNFTLWVLDFFFPLKSVILYLFRKLKYLKIILRLLKKVFQTEAKKVFPLLCLAFMDLHWIPLVFHDCSYSGWWEPEWLPTLCEFWKLFRLQLIGNHFFLRVLFISPCGMSYYICIN